MDMQQGLRAQDICLIIDDIQKRKYDMRLQAEQLRHRGTLNVEKTCRSEIMSGNINSMKDSTDGKTCRSEVIMSGNINSMKDSADVGKTCRSEAMSGNINSMKDSTDTKDDKNRKGKPVHYSY